MQFLDLLLDFNRLRVDFGVDAVIYAGLALLGTALFLIRLGLSLVLGFGDADFDVEDIGHGGFPLISILSLTSFFMGAGWMGLIARVDWGLEPPAASAAAAGFGFFCMLLSASLMFAGRKMTQDVTYDTKTAVGRTGQCYMSIPESGTGSGQVRVSVSGRSMIVNAVSAGPAIEAFADIKVVDVRDDQTLIVEPLA
jgi:hypothetical protein